MLKRWTVSEDQSGTLRTASATERGAFEVVSLLDHEQIVKAEVAMAVGVYDPAGAIAELTAELATTKERFAATQESLAIQGEMLADTREQWRAQVQELRSQVTDPEWIADLNENAKTLIAALDGGPAGRPWWVDAGVSYSKLQGLVR